MSKVLIAIDPGISGAWAAFEFTTGAVLHVDDLPIVRDKTLGWIDGGAFYDVLDSVIQQRESFCIVERVHAMPKNGSKAAFSQGSTLCSALATLQILNVRIEFITPQTWKRDLGLTFAKDVPDTQRKKASLHKGRLMFPHVPLPLEKHHNRAEALLIGHWYLERRCLFKTVAA